MESWHKHRSSLRHERSGRKSRLPSERRKQLSLSCKAGPPEERWDRAMEMLMLLADRAGQYGKWQDSIREDIWPEVWQIINSFWNADWGYPTFRERQIKSTSFWKEIAEWEYSWAMYVPRAGGDWLEDLMIADYEFLQESEASEIQVKRFKS